MKSASIITVGFLILLTYLLYLFVLYSPIQPLDPIFYSSIIISGTLTFYDKIDKNMKKHTPNPILGTFIVEEHEGKKYKMLFVEEVSEELSDWEIVSKISHILRIPDENNISATKSDALFLINYAIGQENEKDQTFGPYQYYWSLKSDGGIGITDVRVSYPAGESFIYPFQHAKSRQVIRKVVEKLGVEIFRIAAGVKRIDL